MTDRPYDVVVFGATGFVGRLTAAYLAMAAPADARIALAGRSRDKLEQVRGTLPVRAHEWPLVVADSSSVADVAALAASTTAVATTVGPYLKYGKPLAEACADAGTHYADLTGEVLFVRDCIDRLHDRALRSGARIVNACGFDSIPSDLGVLLCAEAASADGEGELTDTTMLVAAMRGGVSGGTLDSLRGMVDEMKRDPSARRLMTDPHALAADRSAEHEPQPRDGFLTARYDGRWIAPFVMAPFNTRIVRRSNELLARPFGKAFRYREVMSVGRSPAGPLLAAGVAGGVGALAAGMAVPPTRALLDRVLPAPGEGPSESAREKGHFRTETTALTTGGASYRTTIAAKGDPGYAATAVMLGEAVLALGLDELPDAAGVLTPASGIGVRLADRLRTAGFRIETTRL
ncbi:MAG: saccharopine dehydrogenase NADP-binding domain-containing protein [Mycobacteriales bacterium]|nr:saccharopine dehydrogenase NADP-binding domain-containing protein [Mycobacteriales bacterium]